MKRDCDCPGNAIEIAAQPELNNLLAGKEAGRRCCDANEGRRCCSGSRVSLPEETRGESALVCSLGGSEGW